MKNSCHRQMSFLFFSNRMLKQRVETLKAETKVINYYIVSVLFSCCALNQTATMCFKCVQISEGK